MKPKLFRNDAAKGSFGEFVYQSCLEERGFSVLATRRCEHDFLIRDHQGAAYRVDVKTTTKEITKYLGLKVSDAICYDLVQISLADGRVTIFPDLNSPLANFGPILVNDFSTLEQRWKIYQLTVKIRDKASKANPILDAIRSDLKLSCNERIRFRVLYRGQASKYRWGPQRPDNIIPNAGQRSKFDYTVFVQTKCVQFEEALAELHLFPHSRLEEFETVPSSARQQAKGINEVIDTDLFASQHPELVFLSTAGLCEYINSQTN
jgi:hypothetical protein